MDDIEELWSKIPRNMGSCSLEELVEIGKNIHKVEQRMKKMNKMLYMACKRPLDKMKSTLKLEYKKKLFSPQKFSVKETDLDGQRNFRRSS